MNDLDPLVQRFLDQDLNADERLAFAVRLGRDGGLRQQVLDLEALLAETNRLPRPDAPETFVASVLSRLPPTEAPWRRGLNALHAPRTFQWNLIGAAATACLLVVVGGLLLDRLPRRAPDAPAAASASGSSAVLVRLVIVHPTATTVQAAGDFNGWNPALTPLAPASNGAWTVTIPLEPGRYEYMFVVDGRTWITDPFAAEQRDDGFGARNAVLDVRSTAKAAAEGAM